MATITTTLTIADRMTAPLRNITSALQYTVDALHSVNTATVKGFDTTAVDKAQRAIMALILLNYRYQNFSPL